MNWVDKKCMGWFLYFRSSGNVLDTPAREEMSKKRMVCDWQMKKWVGIVHVKFKPWLKRLEEAMRSVVSVPGCLTDFPEPVDDMPFSEHDIVEEDVP